MNVKTNKINILKIGDTLMNFIRKTIFIAALFALQPFIMAEYHEIETHYLITKVVNGTFNDLVLAIDQAPALFIPAQEERKAYNANNDYLLEISMDKVENQTSSNNFVSTSYNFGPITIQRRSKEKYLDSPLFFGIIEEKEFDRQNLGRVIKITTNIYLCDSENQIKDTRIQLDSNVLKSAKKIYYIIELGIYRDDDDTLYTEITVIPTIASIE